MGVASGSLPRKPVEHELYNTGGGTPVTTAAWFQITAATTKPFSFLHIFNQTSSILKLAVGGAGVEVEIPFYIPPGVEPFFVAFDDVCPKGSRLSVRAVDSTASSGYILLNMMG